MKEPHAVAAEILHKANAIITDDHFVYISGDHGSGWVNKDSLLPYTDKVATLSELLAEPCRALGADIVCGPAIGGLVMSQWVAHFLKLPGVFTEHGSLPKVTEYSASTFNTENGARQQTQAEIRPPFVLKRGFDELIKGKNVLIVDDIVNTGLSIRETVTAVEECGGNVIAAAAYCSRGNVGAEGLNVPNFIYLVEFKIPSWPVASCQLCKDGVPVNTKYAHGADFIAGLAN